jgi:phosphoglycerol transferase
MENIDTRKDERLLSNSPLMLAIILLVAFAGISFRNAGLYPVIFADEWFYNLFSRLVPFESSQRPSYIFYLLYKTSNVCGDGFLECVRLINTLFFVLALPFIYGIARRFVEPRYALLACAISAFSPYNSYTVYFMPESMYYFCFYALTFALVAGIPNKPKITAVLVGAILAIMSMVKPHAVLLFVGIGTAYFSEFFINRKLEYLRSGALLALFSLAAFAVVRFPVGYALAGQSGLHLLGNDYAGYAGAATGMERLLSLLMPSMFNLFGNLLALALLFGVPIALATGAALPSRSQFDKREKRMWMLRFYVASTLGSLVVITAIFIASSVDLGPYESIHRLSMRHYDFLFPLLILFGVIELAKGEEHLNKVQRWLLICVAGLVGYAVITGFRNYAPGLADGPVLRGLTYNQIVFYIFGSICFINITLVLVKRRLGTWIFVALFLPLSTLTSFYYVNKELRVRLIPDAYDRGGKFAEEYLGSEGSKLAIVGADLASLFRANFYMRAQGAEMVVANNGTEIDAASISTDRTWLLLIGDYKIPYKVNEIVHVGASGDRAPLYTLVKIAKDRQFDFRKNTIPAGIQSITGFSVLESFGRWSEADEVHITFSEDLPYRYDLAITGFAFGPNRQAMFKLTAGNDQKSFKLTGEPSTIHMIVSTDKTHNSLRIKIPYPVSPKTLGLSDDNRHLGIAISSIVIRPLAKITEITK